jgi:hypothetical protein
LRTKYLTKQWLRIEILYIRDSASVMMTVTKGFQAWRNTGDISNRLAEILELFFLSFVWFSFPNPKPKILLREEITRRGYLHPGFFFCRSSLEN